MAGLPGLMQAPARVVHATTWSTHLAEDLVVWGSKISAGMALGTPVVVRIFQKGT